jgi:hypothetical protein
MKMASARIEENLAISYQGNDRAYSAEHVAAVLDGGRTVGARTTMTASYRTDTISPTVYYTALYPNGTILTARRTADVALSPCGDYTYEQLVTDVDQFVAVWDEGNIDDFLLERIMVDL